MAAVTVVPGCARADDVSGASGGVSGVSTGSVSPSDVASPSSGLGGGTTRGDLSPGEVTGSVKGEVQQSDQNAARSAVERGEVRPYGWVMKRIKKVVPGEIVRVRLKRMNRDIWAYDVTVLNEAGRLVQVSLNANTGAVISKKTR
jgi:hypothetical protein